MKKICSVLLILCLLLGLCACNQSDPKPTEAPSTTAAPVTEPTTAEKIPVTTAPVTEPADNQQTVSSISPLLYKLTDADGNVAWLFGSIHVGQEYFYPLPDYVTSAYENSDALAVEFDVVDFASDIGAQTQALTKLIYMDGTKISDHIPEDLYNHAVEVLTECSSYMSLLDMYYPALWSSFIENAQLESFDLDTDLGIDMHFLNDAHETDKEIQDVESADFQYGMMANFSEALQIELLESALYSYDNSEEAEADLTALIDAWASGNEDAMVALLTEEPEFESEEEKRLYAEYNDAMLTQRNISMADFAEAALTSGKEVFICVGAAHVVGPGAMVDLLSQRGYTVEQIEA